MIKEHKTFPIFDQKTKEEITLEVNWNDSEDVKDCAMLKMKVGEREFYIKRGDLYMVLLGMLPPEKQKSLLMPFVKKTDIRYQRQMVEIEAQKRIERGEKITAFINVPVSVYENI